jgi:dTDP-4-dehydrorhamnose 3,5-epimerase
VIFSALPLPGAFLIEPEPHEDERGAFARIWCEREFEAHGLDTSVAQSSISINRRAGTLRGLHYQAAPHEEVKIVRCTHGAIFDAIVDLRHGSPTFCRPYSVVLSAANHRMLYIPKGFAHGFQTLEDDTEVFYQISEFYSPEHARGVRWDDPAFGITWPEDERTIVDRDRTYPDFDAAGFALR